MNNRTTNENSNNYELVSTIEDFESLLDSNHEPIFFQINQSVDSELVNIRNEFIRDEDPSAKVCKCQRNMILNRLSDLLMFCFILLTSFFQLVAVFLMIIEFSFSFYSILIMNYVFFISSIVSYTMAPIYKITSGNWLDFFLSFAQVIISSPLIAFYIIYLIKSVKNLGEFFQNTPESIKMYLYVHKVQYKNSFMIFLSNFFDWSYELMFEKEEMIKICNNCIVSFAYFLFFSLVGYISFFLAKFIISLGIICYIINTGQIFAIIIPSYIYFFQTIFNFRSKKFKYLNKIDRFYKKLMKLKDDESEKDVSKPKKANSKPDSDESISNESESYDSDTNKSNKIKKVIITFFNFFKSLFDFEEEEEEDEESDKILDDDFISELEDEDKERSNKKFQLLMIVFEYILAHNYMSLYYFSTEIAFDRHKQWRKRLVMSIFLFLNLAVISYDIYRLIQDYSDYLLSSIIIRFILIPFFAYFNIITVLYHKAKDKIIRGANIASLIFVICIIALIIFCFSYKNIYNSKYRIKNLEYVPPFNNITIANEKMMLHPICTTELLNISIFDAFGYALAGYDIKRNKTVFDNQMKIFFGENYSNHISYTIYEVEKYFLLIKFYDSSIDSTIFAIKGYTTGPEIAFQFELFASKYIINWFEDIVPLFEFINDNWLGFYTDFLHSFGLRFFENRNIIVKYVNSIKEIYNKENFDDNDKVVFTGINTGGVIAKIVGTLLNHKSISFISFPMELDFLQHLFHFSSTYYSYVTNVFDLNGFFSLPDANGVINIGIDVPNFFQSRFCTSDFCGLFSKLDNTYRTFCTMSEICGKGNQFNYYCRNVIGEKNLEKIRENLQDSDD